MKVQALRLGASTLALTAALGGAAAAQVSVGTPPASTPVNGKASAIATPSGNAVSEVVVTAERRTTNLQKTPIAATVLNQSDLFKNGVVTVDQLQFVSPSLAVDNFGQGNDIDIRGIGKGEHNTQTGTGVVTYRDGLASFPGYFQEEPYYDVASLEVLRGPQGTFSGQNSTGGAVIVNTQDPKINGGYTGYLYGHYGNYDDTGLQGAVNLPISDTLAARVAFNGETRDSFYHITGLTNDPNLHWGSARFSLLWQPNANLKVLWKTDYNYLDNGGYFGDALLTPTGQLNPTNSLFKFANNYETYATDQFVRNGLHIDYKFDDGITLRSVTGYQRGRTGWNGDIDGTNLTGVNPATGAAYPNYIINEKSDETIWSQELNLISPEGGFFNWILGGYYNHNQYNFPATFDIGVPPGGFDEDLYGHNPTGTYAAFGQVSFNLPHGFQLQGGVRYSLWSTSNQTVYFVPEYAPLLTQPQDQRYHGNNLTGKVTLNWNLDSRNFLYAFVASGAKPGGLNTSLYTYPQQPIPAPFGQEYVVDYEIGWKSRFLNNHVRTQVGAYYNDFFNFQLSVPLPNNPQFTTEVNNTSPTRLYGFEGSVQAVFGHLNLNGNLGLEHSALGAFYAEDSRIAVGGTCDPNIGPASTACVNLKGHPQQYAPDFTFNVGAQYDFALPNEDKLTPGVTFGHVSSQYGTIFDNVSQGDYLTPRNILGSSLAWTHGTFTATLYGYNLTNDQYVSAILPPIRIAGNPRQFGVSVLKTF